MEEGRMSPGPLIVKWRWLRLGTSLRPLIVKQRFFASSRLKPRWKEGKLRGSGGLCWHYGGGKSEQRVAGQRGTQPRKNDKLK